MMFDWLDLASFWGGCIVGGFGGMIVMAFLAEALRCENCCWKDHH